MVRLTLGLLRCWFMHVRLRLGVMRPVHILLVRFLRSWLVSGRFGMMFRRGRLRSRFMVRRRRRLGGGGLIMGRTMGRWRRGSMMPRTVINDENLVARDDATNEGEGHHASDKGREEFHRSSLYRCHFVSMRMDAKR